MKHVGDITKLNGAELPIVDIITGGSPCQDLSVAGKREGLAGERSGLFMEQIRLIKRRDMTNEEREEAIQYFKNLKLIQADAYMQEAMQAAISALSQPQITEGAYKQVMWERDTAIKQLNDLGYEFGEKIEPCEDTISRQATLASIKNLYPDIPVMDIFGSRRKWLEKYAPYFECENAIEQLPPVIPQPKTGHWIEEIDDYGKVIHWHCDKCYEDSGFTTDCKYSYCPNCGTKMVEPQGSEG